MTDYQLRYYKMSEEELEEWNRLAVDVKECIMSVPLLQIPYELKKEIIERCTDAHSQYDGSKGYIKDKGFYAVSEGDRGALYLQFSEATYEETKNILLKKCAHDISFEYVNKHQAEYQNRYKDQWHFCQIYDRYDQESNRMIYHMQTYDQWIFDTEYDYRKYWFELLLLIEKKVLPLNEYKKEVTCYEDSLNHHMTDHKWDFDYDKETFILL